MTHRNYGGSILTCLHTGINVFPCLYALCNSEADQEYIWTHVYCQDMSYQFLTGIWHHHNDVFVLLHQLHIHMFYSVVINDVGVIGETFTVMAAYYIIASYVRTVGLY
jgi:hypothetical protein